MANLDPDDFGSLARFFHEALEAGLEHYRGLEDVPVWQPAPEAAWRAFTGPVPREGQPPEQLLDHFRDYLIPYTNGNLHPGFFGWVHGSGNLYGALGELCSALLNNNLGGRNHIAHAVEAQVIQWSRELFGFPSNSSGLLVSGTSMASVIALAVARQWALGEEVKKEGVQGKGPVLVGYCSTQTHGALVKAFQLLGLGSDALRRVPVRDDHSLDTEALREAIANDRRAGFKPFAIIGTACTVNTGAIDDLADLADICEQEQLWFHVDAAFGAALALLEEYADDLEGLNRADSVGFDFHKWFQVPYAVGGVLVRDAAAHRSTFSEPVEYLETQSLGLEAGAPWPCDLGPELSRGFLALKVWFTFQGVGLENMAASVRKHCRLARELESRVNAADDLELLAPVRSNIVCLRYQPPGANAAVECSEYYLNALNRAIVTQLQLQGVSAPSTTKLDGSLAIRVAIVNHRTEWEHLDQLLHHTRRIGEQLDQCYPALLNPTHWHFMQGGDGRLIVDPVTGLNRYGCSPAPRDHAFTFASSTASSVSRQAYEAAEHYRQQLLHDLVPGDPGKVIPDCFRQLEQRLMQLLGLADLAPSVFLVPSGTDAQLLAVGVAANDSSASWVSVVCMADETGSGTPESVTGRHFDDETCLGVPVTRGERLAGMPSIDYSAVDVHNEAGAIRSPAEMDAAVERHVGTLVRDGYSVILHAMEQSKLGRWCPSRDVMDRLRANYGDKLQIVVDACQLRTDWDDLRSHLADGDILLLTGSKFFTGPPFSGAAVFPDQVCRRITDTPQLPEGLSEYLPSDALGEWASMVPGAEAVVQTGVLLRWRAALAEIERYYAVPDALRIDGLNRFSEQVMSLLREHPLVDPLFESDDEWWARDDFSGRELSNRRSIFPFLVRECAGGAWLDPDRAKKLYQLLNQELETDTLEPLSGDMQQAARQCCHIGQPVPLKGTHTAALRISMGARIVSDGYAAGDSFEHHLEEEIRQIVVILDKIKLCVSQSLV
ncbi:glutamate/tyrosine decarboxylase-like PLP-dependent enzyme [Halospina denitrificans]|uniref:Glutamate/tyrosine decarboxylase-like PLP-dependent enzyme n=1 Tax=Halospina denitrificans TaxID=332522 RepID=A0A4R7JTB6_9GAMM|nr:pyridoxal-dependent decarboxylase [Halospina denitrificans]TDT41561.1 glutamate/tyrosine decarboxylase-like PLP-dependent enzyme [Halospina denitrificans]